MHCWLFTIVGDAKTMFPLLIDCGRTFPNKLTGGRIPADDEEDDVEDEEEEEEMNEVQHGARNGGNSIERN